MSRGVPTNEGCLYPNGCGCPDGQRGCDLAPTTTPSEPGRDDEAGGEVADLAESLRDWRLAGCEHSSQFFPDCCAPCLREHIIAAGYQRNLPEGYAAYVKSCGYLSPAAVQQIVDQREREVREEAEAEGDIARDLYLRVTNHIADLATLAGIFNPNSTSSDQVDELCAAAKAEGEREVREQVGVGAIIHVTHADAEEYARIFNEGYEAACAQNLADDPSFWQDWLTAQLAAAEARGAAAVVERVEAVLAELEHDIDCAIHSVRHISCDCWQADITAALTTTEPPVGEA